MKDLEQLLIRINLLDDSEIDNDLRWDIIDTLNNYINKSNTDGSVMTASDNRTQEEKDLKTMWDEGETFR